MQIQASWLRAAIGREVGDASVSRVNLNLHYGLSPLLHQQQVHPLLGRPQIGHTQKRGCG